MKMFLKLFLMLCFIITGILLYATYIGTEGLVTKEYTIYEETIPEEFDGLKIVHFSDLHFGRTVDIEKVNNIVTEINLINPDIVFFTGDLIDKDITINKDDKFALINALKNINSKYGKFAVLGNHDYLIKEDILKLYEDSNFKFLENEYETIISRNNQYIYVMGLGNSSYNLDNVSEMIKDVKDKEGFKIVLTHEPDISDTIINNIDVNLILAGHSHNGQFRLPFMFSNGDFVFRLILSNMTSRP